MYSDSKAKQLGLLAPLRWKHGAAVVSKSEQRSAVAHGARLSPCLYLSGVCVCVCAHACVHVCVSNCTCIKDSVLILIWRTKHWTNKKIYYWRARWKRYCLKQGSNTLPLDSGSGILTARLHDLLVCCCWSLQLFYFFCCFVCLFVCFCSALIFFFLTRNHTFERDLPAVLPSSHQNWNYTETTMTPLFTVLRCRSTQNEAL